MEQFIDKEEHVPVIIATYRYGLQIAKLFRERGLKQGEDFFLWDNQHIFYKDDIIEEYIAFNKKLWKENRKYSTRESVILIPFDNKHTTSEIVPVAYCANYFSQKCDARIEGYFRFGAAYENVSEVFLDIYQSFNMTRVVPYGEMYVDNTIVDALMEQIWDKLNDWEDWKNITVFGIKIGTTIIRHLLRLYVLPFDATDERLRPYLREAICNIVFWYEYFENNDVKVVLFADAVSWEGYIREIALNKGIPSYIVDYCFSKTFKNYHLGAAYPYYRDFWNELSQEEKEYGID